MSRNLFLVHLLNQDLRYFRSLSKKFPKIEILSKLFIVGVSQLKLIIINEKIAIDPKKVFYDVSNRHATRC